MQTILVIYEMIPESTNMYLLHVGEDDASKIKSCAGCFINSSSDWQEKPTEWLYKFLQGREKVNITKSFKITKDTTVVHTGFVM